MLGATPEDVFAGKRLTGRQIAELDAPGPDTLAAQRANAWLFSSAGRAGQACCCRTG